MLAAAVVNIIQWLVIAGKFRFESRPIPLHFNAFYGTELVGPAYFAYQLPIVGLVFLWVNFYLASRFLRYDRFLARLCVWLTVVIQIMLAAAAISVIAANR